MAGKSLEQRNKILDLLYGGVAYTPVKNHYVALHLIAPDNDGTHGSEVPSTGTNYARLLVPNDSTTWGAAAGGTKSNVRAFIWPPATGPWGTVVAVTIWDAASGGNMIASGMLGTAMSIGGGAIASIQAGDFSVTES